LSLRSTSFQAALALLIVVGGAGCGVDKEKGILMAAGSYGDLAVVVNDDAMRPLARNFLARFNSEKTFVIKNETLFKPDIFGPDKWDLSKGYKNALYLIHIGGGGDAEKEARNMMSDEAWQRISAGGGGIVQVKDPWSTYQLLVVVASKDRNSLGSLLRKNEEKLRTIFQESNRDRILRRNRHDGLQLELMERYWQDLGFFLEIPREYKQNQYRPDGYPGVELMRTGPSRGITVTWTESADPVRDLANFDLLTRLRAELGTRMHDEEILPETFVWSETELSDAPAVKLEGAWNSNRFAGGGAFWCYFVPDTSRGRIYCLDLLAYAPGMDKMNFFRRLDAVASTFATKRPQS
jgi:hypothetical protein